MCQIRSNNTKISGSCVWFPKKVLIYIYRLGICINPNFLLFDTRTCSIYVLELCVVESCSILGHIPSRANWLSAYSLSLLEPEMLASLRHVRKWSKNMCQHPVVAYLSCLSVVKCAAMTALCVVFFFFIQLRQQVFLRSSVKKNILNLRCHEFFSVTLALEHASMGSVYFGAFVQC